MTRAKKPKKDCQTEPIMVRFTPTEKKQIEKKAKKQNLAAWVREHVLAVIQNT